MKTEERTELIAALKTLRKHVGDNQIDINFSTGEIYFNDPDGAVYAHVESSNSSKVEETVAEHNG